jgi:PKD domain-containing protein
MPCSVVIQDVLGQGQPGVPLMSLKVSGVATECQSVSVSIVCTAQAVTHANVPVSGGKWETVFNEQELKIAGCRECGSPSYPITVRVHCADPGSSCGDSKVFSQIPCQTACPTIQSIQADIPSCDEVVAAGGWTVAFSAPINGTGVTYCLWTFGDGSNPVAGSLPVGGVATAQHQYQCAGTYPVTLTILSACQPNYLDSETLQLELPPCGCPTVSDFKAEQDVANRCLWRFKLTIGAPFVGCIEQYLWNFGDGQQGATSVPEAEHVYAADGHYTVTVTLLGGIGAIGGGPCYASKPISISNCGHHGDNGGNGHPCPWWKPRCWKSLCGALLAAAMASLVAAGLLFIIAGCVVLTPAILAGPMAAALQLLVSSALFLTALGFLAAGLALLTTWFIVCAHMPGYHFCAVLHQVKTAIAWIILSQTVLALGLFLIAGWGCLIGLGFTWTAYGTVLAYLQLIGNWAGCRH